MGSHGLDLKPGSLLERGSTPKLSIVKYFIFLTKQEREKKIGQKISFLFEFSCEFFDENLMNYPIKRNCSSTNFCSLF